MTFPIRRRSGPAKIAAATVLVASALIALVAAGGPGRRSSALRVYPPVNTAPRVYSRPPGLIQGGDSKSTCIIPKYQGNLLGSLQAVEQYTHVRYDCIVTYSNADVTWAHWARPWLTEPKYGFTDWVAADPLHRTIVITQNLVPDQVDLQPGWEQTCAAGAFRKYGVSLAEHLVAVGFDNSVVRLGPEMNGNWYYDSLGSTPAAWRAWAQCFAQIVKAMRSVPGQHFLFDWNVNAGYRVIPLADFYPGDKYVDIVGIDFYDSPGQGPLPPVPTPARWEALVSEPLGLEEVYRFARAHHKPLSIPEWGTVGKAGDGDDPYYVEGVGQFVAGHDVAYEAWFDTGGENVLTLTPGSAPGSLGAYVKEFGPGSYVASYQARIRR